MYGLSYCRLDLDYLLETDLYIIDMLIKAEIDRELRRFDTDMCVKAWQTANLMNATGNYKKAVKPADLYESQFKPEAKPVDVQKQKEELLKSFNITM